jgi:hypothetical protein
LTRLSKQDRQEAKLRSRDHAAFLVRDHGNAAEEVLRAARSRKGLTDLKRYQLKCIAGALVDRRRRDRAKARSTALAKREPSAFSLAGIARMLGLSKRPKSRRSPSQRRGDI